MRVRFTQPVSVPGGPRYLAGEVADTDRWLLTDARAQTYIQRGLAEEIMASHTQAPQGRTQDRPTRDKMLERAPAKKA